jgi:hypothetical protein
MTVRKCFGYGRELCRNRARHPKDDPLWCDYHERKRRARIDADFKELTRAFETKKVYTDDR